MTTQEQMEWEIKLYLHHEKDCVSHTIVGEIIKNAQIGNLPNRNTTPQPEQNKK